MKVELENGKVVEKNKEVKDRIKGILLGIILLAVAACLIAQQLGFDLQIVSMRWYEWILLAISVCGLIDGILEKHLWKIAFSLGIGYCVLDTLMGWPEINLFVMILAIGVAGAGIHIIFFKSGKHKGTLHITRDNGEEVDIEYHGKEDFKRVLHEEMKDEDVELFEDGIGKDVTEYLTGDVVFSNVTKYVTSQNFVGGNGDVVFSTEKVYLDQANLFNGTATLNMDVVFSTLIVFVPRNWRIIDNMDRFLASRAGSFEGSGENPPTLILNGDCVFGTVKVERV